MNISLITISFNSVNTIAETIESVLSQDFGNFEYIIIDGGSSDGTLKIIDNYRMRINQLVVEKDSGIYNAMNKGIKLAKGDIVGFLHSDDVFANDHVLTAVANCFNDDSIDAIYGNLEFVKHDNLDAVIRKWKCSEHRPGGFVKGWHPPHPTFYVKKECYEKYGGFNESLAISADFELMLRLFEVAKIKTFFLDQTLVKMRYGGESTRSISNIFRGNRNILRAFKLNRMAVPYFYFINRFTKKLLQFIYN